MFTIVGRAALVGMLAIAALSASAGAASSALGHVRGTITKVTSTSLAIATSRGPVEVGLTSSTAIAGVVPASLSDIKSNSFLGVTNIRMTGAARAVGVLLLPDSLRSTRSGNFAWDFPTAGSSNSAMTNGTVHAAMTNGTTQSSMTNGTVSHSSNNGALTVTLDYKGGTTVVMIPPGTPVARIVPASRSTLKPGAHVFAFVSSSNGKSTAVRLIVGEQGIVPPM
jgi:hypothetical protein